MAKKRPVKIWIPRHNPRREPKFHQAEILIGAGRSTKALFIILSKGCVLRKLDIDFILGLVLALLLGK